MFIRKKAFTLIEVTLVTAIIGVLVIVMFQSYTYIVEQTKERKIYAGLDAIKNGMIQYRNMYGYWPESPEEVINRGLVKWEGGKTTAVDVLYNEFGYTYTLENSIRGLLIKTKYKRGNVELEASRAVSPAYKAGIGKDTILLVNFDAGDFILDFPRNIEPAVNGTVLTASGNTSMGKSARFNGNGGLNYGVNVENFKKITIEFWAQFTGSQPAGNTTIFKMLSNNNLPQVPAWARFDRLIEISITPTDLIIDFNAFDLRYGSTNPQGYNLYKITKSLASVQTPTGNTVLLQNMNFSKIWHHFAFVYTSDPGMMTSSVQLFIDGYPQNISLIRNPGNIDVASGDYYPFDFGSERALWRNNIYIGMNETGNNRLNNINLDNICVTYDSKSEGSFVP